MTKYYFKITDTFLRTVALFVITAVILLCGVTDSLASDLPEDETLLMFVGEANPTVTVASRSPESPLTAPAMVHVVDRDQIERNGYRTLAELLADQPGFYLASAGRGTVSYLRGLPESVLYLYDGVPLTSDVTKGFSLLDYEISLRAVERVEILRGAGSVLWGVDAFSGVVNIIPRRATGESVIQASLTGGNHDQRIVDASVQQQQQDWNAFLFGSDARDRFDGQKLTLTSTTEEANTPKSRYQEVVGTFSYRNIFHLSGRWSDFERKYTMQSADEDISWQGTRQIPMKFIKANLSNDWGASHYSLTGFYQETNYQVLDADVERRQLNRVTQLEFLWDRRLFSRGILTLGATWRRNAVAGAVVQDGFLPDFLAPEETLFTPAIYQKDFVNRRLSFFGQYRYQWHSSACWAGVRYEEHSQYSNNLSYSLGLQRTLTPQLNIKAVYGTAYRSPYSSQLFDDQKFEPESVQSLSVELTWKPVMATTVELRLYHNRLRDHIVEDPYGGLSLPSDRELYGAELFGQTALTSTVDITIGLTLQDGSRGDENYRVLAFSILRPDGTQTDTYDSWSEAFDSGPRWLAYCGLHWHPMPNHRANINVRGGGSYSSTYNKGTLKQNYRAPLLVDFTYRFTGFVIPQCSITLRATNLLDQDYEQPDIYGPVKGTPLRATLNWEICF